MKVVKDNIYSTINNLYDELDNAKEERKELNFDTEFDILWLLQLFQFIKR
jgi:hypothetical protein